MENISLIILLVILVLIVREGRAGNQIVRADPNIELQPSERFRTLRMQLLEPLVAVVVVGSLLVTDLERAPGHAVAALVGAVAGYVFGAYRARATYVAAVPAHQGVILRYGIASFLTLGLLLVINRGRGRPVARP
ncbi:hypothetical protein [Ornithinimicrobium sediminis]|uniref:hypothetical protein n=1 Tax=Ornithinimicrobium sediminis TaxID=2904603 RepID=UPI001E44E49E|nr:hypothetical protein [Ornithinimicrobium sediminis]MCE0486968.1 hypothetical protein [Ornithinimicrobium sediminis]